MPAVSQASHDRAELSPDSSGEFAGRFAFGTQGLKAHILFSRPFRVGRGILRANQRQVVRFLNGTNRLAAFGRKGGTGNARPAFQKLRDNETPAWACMKSVNKR